MNVDFFSSFFGRAREGEGAGINIKGIHCFVPSFIHLIVLYGNLNLVN